MVALSQARADESEHWTSACPLEVQSGNAAAKRSWRGGPTPSLGSHHDVLSRRAAASLAVGDESAFTTSSRSDDLRKREFGQAPPQHLPDRASRDRVNDEKQLRRPVTEMSGAKM